ncbi:hypothetical protein INT44_000311 [Umbelopsis vinacea]|uniref:RRM domain-containing protein n=1 Tax=Umbelopsis vinacea TaxID=44442 RepID=A0A8H7PKU2_9FUNG|nr:hypothetical protein INT44_000311 [Umbelopsis vinacea]
MSTRVYLGRLARDCRDRDIEKLFRGYGDIREINLKNGFGFVEFRDNRDAEDVVYDFHGKEFLGERLIVEIARGNRRREERGGGRGGRRDDRSQHRLIVNGIAPGTSWQDLKDFMRKAGEVSFADILKDRDGEGLVIHTIFSDFMSTSFAFTREIQPNLFFMASFSVVEFRSRSDMKAALERLDGQELNGHEVTLREADKDRRSNRRSRSRSDSRSPPRRSRRRSPSRSRSRSPRRSSRRDRDDERRRSPSRDRSASPERESEDRNEKRSSSRRERSASRSRSPAKEAFSDRSRSGSPAPREEEGDISPMKD